MCGGGLDLVPEGAKNVAKRSERAQIVEMCRAASW